MKTVSFRVVIAILTSLASGLVLSGCGDPDDDDDDDRTDAERIIVVGAGMAGLGAARTLHDSGCCEVIVLEAQDRVGGRVYSIETPVTRQVVEGSAQYHMGQTRSSLTPLIQNMGIRTKDYDWSFESWDVDGTRKPVTPKQWERFEEDITNEAQRYVRQPDVSMQTMIDEMVAKKKLSYLDNERELGFCVATIFQQEYVSDASENRASGPWEGGDLFGGDEYFPDGMSAIPEFLAKGLDIRLGTPVTAIRYDEDSVTVETAKGAKFEADRVVVTVPLGVLKAGDIVFDPPLPSTHTDAIKRLGFGMMNKVWLIFPEIFWDPKIDFKGYVSVPAGEYSSWNYWGGKALLVWHAGSDAVALERHTDEEIIEGAMDTLRIMYGNNIPDPTETVVMRFDINGNAKPTPLATYTKGAYSFLKVGSTPDDRMACSEPIMNRVFFAGEHTNNVNPALVQGAYDTGVWQANIITGLR